MARAAVAAFVLIVASGATVRSTGSGLGCPSVTFDLSACEKAYGSRGYHADIEFFNRGASGLVVVAALALAVAAWRTAALERRAKLLALGAFLATFTQIPLGAITVHDHLNPHLVIAHFLVALFALALGVLVLLDADRAVEGAGEPLPRLARLGGAALLSAVTVLVVSGTLSTAAGRFPGSSGTTVVRRLWDFHSAVYWHVRAVAVFGVVLLALAAWAWTRARALPVAAARVHRPPRAPARADGDRRAAVPHVRNRAVGSGRRPRRARCRAVRLDGRSGRTPLAAREPPLGTATRLAQCRS